MCNVQCAMCNVQCAMCNELNLKYPIILQCLYRFKLVFNFSANKSSISGSCSVSNWLSLVSWSKTLKNILPERGSIYCFVHYFYIVLNKRNKHKIWVAIMSEFHHTKEPILNMSQLLQANFHGNPRLRRIAHAFSWRQVRTTTYFIVNIYFNNFS